MIRIESKTIHSFEPKCDSFSRWDAIKKIGFIDHSCLLSIELKCDLSPKKLWKLLVGKNGRKDEADHRLLSSPN